MLPKMRKKEYFKRNNINTESGIKMKSRKVQKTRKVRKRGKIRKYKAKKIKESMSTHG